MISFAFACLMARLSSIVGAQKNFFRGVNKSRLMPEGMEEVKSARIVVGRVSARMVTGVVPAWRHESSLASLQSIAGRPPLMTSHSR